MSRSLTLSLKSCGWVQLEASATALTACTFVRSGSETSTPQLDASDPANRVLLQAASELREYDAGTRTRFDVPVAFVGGTPFQRAVWAQLLAIGHGQVATYKDVCVRLGKPSAARAVGAACGKNPVAIVVPCHRVVGSTGALTGFAGGLDTKAALLQHEKAAAAADDENVEDRQKRRRI